MRATTFRVILATSLAAAGLAADYENEPGRGVARISLINGDVSVRRGDSGDWIAAAVNAPLVVQDYVTTGPGSRAEVQFDYANMIRLASDTEIRLAQIESQRYIVQVARGTVTFRVLRDSDADVEISTPSVSVRPIRRGSYRVTVQDGGESEITVRSGEAEIFTPRGVERLRSGRTMLARGDRSDPEYQIVSAIGRDSWDRWNEERDKYFSRSRGYQYAHHSVYGLDDLDYHGGWHYIPPYGWCWRPRVAVGWAPYHYGRWTWIDWYGWSWVSHDPWGWAPYHYGRWFYNSPHGWYWWPGGRYTRHYWKPALVAFFGFGSHHGFRVGFGFGYGRIGWVPLAPYEPYYPWYGRHYYRGYRHGGYVDNSVNIVNNINITNIYRNARVRGAVAGIDAGDFGRGAARGVIRVNTDDVRRVALVRGQVPLVPERESLRLVNRDVPGVNVPRGGTERRFFSRRDPAPVERVPFEDQRRGVERIARATFGEETRRDAAGAVRSPGPARGETSGRAVAGSERNVGRVPAERGAASESGWRRAGPETRAAEAENRDQQGWRRFGQPVARPGAPRVVEPRAAEPSRQQIQGGEDRVPRAAEGTGGSRRFGEGEGRVERPVGRDDAGAWRRLGEPSSGAERRVEREDSGWRRFGERQRDTGQPEGLIRREQTGPRVERMQEQPRNRGVIRSEPSENMRRFQERRSQPADRGEPLRQQRSDPGFGVPRDAPRRSEAPRVERQQSDRIRISPSIVRERAAPRSQAPRMSAPRYEAPRSAGGGGQVRSAPRSSGESRSSAPRSSSGGRSSRGRSDR